MILELVYICVVVLLVKREECIHKLSKVSSQALLFITYSADRKLGGNLGARLISNVQVCYSNDCDTVLGL